MTSNVEAGDTRTGVTASAPKPAESGPYALDGYRLSLVPASGPPQTLSVFRADPEDGMLVVGGSNDLKVEQN